MGVGGGAGTGGTRGGGALAGAVDPGQGCGSAGRTARGGQDELNHRGTGEQGERRADTRLPDLYAKVAKDAEIWNAARVIYLATYL